MSEDEKIIMGIDPGTNLMGYGVIGVRGKSARMIAMGVIDLRKVSDIYLKLGRIYERTNSLLVSFKPDIMSIESQFYGKNPQSMLKLGRAQGVAISAAINRDIPIHEYAPLKIKMAITGNGQASKEQVKTMLQKYMNISESNILPYLDATDALAVAYCHFLENCSPVVSHFGDSKSYSTHTPRSSKWSDFVKNNPNRIKPGK